MMTSPRGPSLAPHTDTLDARHLALGSHGDAAAFAPSGHAPTPIADGRIPVALESPRADRARALLLEAEARLGQARRHLASDPPGYAAALAGELAVIRASLGAFLTWGGSVPVDGEAELTSLADRAVRLASVFKTSARRAGHLIRRAPAIEAALRRGGRPSVADREAVETGWYTARNLYWTALGQIPASLHPPTRRPASRRAGHVRALA